MDAQDRDLAGRRQADQPLPVPSTILPTIPTFSGWQLPGVRGWVRARA